MILDVIILFYIMVIYLISHICHYLLFLLLFIFGMNQRICLFRFIGNLFGKILLLFLGPLITSWKDLHRRIAFFIVSKLLHNDRLRLKSLMEVCPRILLALFAIVSLCSELASLLSSANNERYSPTHFGWTCGRQLYCWPFPPETWNRICCQHWSWHSRCRKIGSFLCFQIHRSIHSKTVWPIILKSHQNLGSWTF